MTNIEKDDCKNRIDKANAEMKAICDKYQIEPVITANFMLGDVKYKKIVSPIQKEDLK